MRYALAVVLLALAGCARNTPPKPQSVHASVAGSYGAIVSGSYNLIVGKEAGYDMLGGSYNVCIGDRTCPSLVDQDCVVDFRPSFGRKLYLERYWSLDDWRRANRDTVIPILIHCPATKEIVAFGEWWIDVGNDTEARQRAGIEADRDPWAVKAVNGKGK